jgi:RNA polymerase sigma-70 factor (ECF subfamily)
MGDEEFLAERFEANRSHLRAVAYRMLGSATEADDAVQEAWIRLSRSDTTDVENLSGWLTTVTARVCLDMLRSRGSRREEPLEDAREEPVTKPAAGIDPEDEAVLADSVGLALLVVLETLTPAERLAFVLHDLFAVPFDEIAPIVARSPAAARQLASRARRRVQGPATVPESDVARQREVVEAFLAAARGGDFDRLLALLDPDVVLHVDPVAVPAGAPTEIRGAEAVAGQARTFASRARFARPALINGVVGAVVAPRGQLQLVQRFRVVDRKIVELEVIVDPERLSQLELAVLDA